MVTRFDNIGDLKLRALVKSAGMVVESVADISFDDQTLQATVMLNLETRYLFPKKTSGKILISGSA